MNRRFNDRETMRQYEMRKARSYAVATAVVFYAIVAMLLVALAVRIK